jgi:hypothetical protein
MFVEPRRAANATNSSANSVGQRKTSNMWNSRFGACGVAVLAGRVGIRECSFGSGLDSPVDEG